MELFGLILAIAGALCLLVVVLDRMKEVDERNQDSSIKWRHLRKGK